MALDVIILDLDGTLLDTNHLHARAWLQAMREFGYGLGEDRVHLEIGKSGSLLVSDLLGDGVEETHGPELRDAHDRIYLELLDREGARSFSGARELFERIRKRGLRSVVVTGSAEESLRKASEMAGLDIMSLADEVVSDDDVETGKPSPDGLLTACEKLGVSPGQCALIGDTPFDVEAGRRGGIVTIGVASGAHSAESLRRHGARAVYSDVGELGEQLDDALVAASPGPLRLTEEAMRGLMDEAIKEARRALESGDLPVGAVIADGEGTIVSRACSTTESSGNFLNHAEMRAFQGLIGKVQIGRRDLILITTLEPCMMCLGAAMDARVDTILYALDAPSNGGTRRCDPMQSPGMIMPRIIGRICREESRALFEEWALRRPDAPFVQDLLARTAA